MTIYYVVDKNFVREREVPTLEEAETQAEILCEDYPDSAPYTVLEFVSRYYPDSGELHE